MTKTKVNFGGINDISTVDWNGHISAVVFFSGCNWKCRYCHNPDLLPPSQSKDIDDVLELIISNPLVDSVVFSGGECTLQSEALHKSCELSKSVGLDVAIESNGSRPKVFESLLNKDLLDAVFLDAKVNPYDIDIELIKAHPIDIAESMYSYRLVDNSNVPLELRTTCFRNLCDTDVIHGLGTWIQDNLSDDVHWQLQQGLTGECLDDTLNSPTFDYQFDYDAMKELGRIANTYVKNVNVSTQAGGIEVIGRCKHE